MASIPGASALVGVTLMLTTRERTGEGAARVGEATQRVGLWLRGDGVLVTALLLSQVPEIPTIGAGQHRLRWHLGLYRLRLRPPVLSSQLDRTSPGIHVE